MIFSSSPQFGSHAESIEFMVAGSGSCNSYCSTTRAQSLALCVGTPRKRIRCSLGLCTKAASRCMNSSGNWTKCVLPSRQEVFNLSTTWPAALVCTRSLANAKRADMNVLRLMGHRGLFRPDAPVRHKAKRYRIKTVM